MPDPHSNSLVYPLRRGGLEPVPGEALVLGLGLADASAVAAHGGSACLVQGFRPHFLELSAAGVAVKPTLAGEERRFQRALVRLGRHRGQNERWLYEAVARLAPGGTVVAAGARTDGAASMRKRLSRMVSGIGHAAVNHGDVFWFAVSDPEALAARLPVPEEGLVEGRYHSAPGMFSHARVDPGSRLLADCLPGDLGGKVADFGAGWGYLSARIAARQPAPARIDLYEADYDSLEAARRNVTAGPDTTLGFHWLDLTREKPAQDYDAIVMNPPFHTGRRAEPDLGSSLIRAAAAALRPGGQLFLVANRQLPYESVLRSVFSSMRELRLAEGYKAIAAAGPVIPRYRAASVRRGSASRRYCSRNPHSGSRR